MKHFWNERFGGEEYVYGMEPNQFFADQLVNGTLEAREPGRMLLPMEGEGRNAVFAARHGWRVDAYDYSDSARHKAMRLAESAGVRISYEIMDMTNPGFRQKSYDAAGLIYAHLPRDDRIKFHKAVENALAPGGVIILEAFHTLQQHNTSGGPGNPDMLYSADVLRNDFAGMHFIMLDETKTSLQEGEGHRGKADVVRAVIAKPN